SLAFYQPEIPDTLKMHDAFSSFHKSTIKRLLFDWLFEGLIALLFSPCSQQQMSASGRLRPVTTGSSRPKTACGFLPHKKPAPASSPPLNHRHTAKRRALGPAFQC
ncbi:hypothetical protein ACSOZA_006688, partial [Pseudomonas aeruginosa]